MRNKILDLAKDTLEFLQAECAKREIDDKAIDHVLEVVKATKPPHKIFIED